MVNLWREAKPAPWQWNLFKSFLWTILFWFTFLALLPWIIYQLETILGISDFRFASPLWQWCGVALFCFGGLLGPTSSIAMAVYGKGTPLPMDGARQLVIVGPYKFIRNPMAVAGITQGVAVGLYVGSPSIVAYALMGAIIWNIFVRPQEEADLLNRFGNTYQLYREAVWCWVPRFPGFKG